MPLDPSVLAGAGPKPIDIGSLIEMARGKQRLDAESSMGDIYAGATTDGATDPGKLGTAANMHRAGPYAQQLASHVQELQQGQNRIDAGHLENARSWLQLHDRVTYPLINKPDLDYHDVLDAIHSLVGTPTSMLKGGMFTATHATQAASWVYGPNGQPKEGPELAKGLKMHHAQVLNNLEQSEPIKVGVDEDGRDVYKTRSGFIIDDPTGSLSAPGRTGGPAQGAAPTGSRAPAQGAATFPFSTPTGFEEAAKASGTQLGAERTANSNYRREVTPLEQAIPALSRLDKYGTGPGTDEVNKIKSFLQSAGAGGLLGIDPQKIKDFDEAKKYMVDWIMASGTSGVGGRNADALAAAFSSNPNVGISKAANADIMKSALALRRMKYAQQAEFDQTGLPEGRYGKWAPAWNAKQDPRAYGFDLMTRDAAAKFLKSLSPEERKRFDASHAIAERHDLQSPRRGWNAE